jgi:hypothetical protein
MIEQPKLYSTAYVFHYYVNTGVQTFAYGKVVKITSKHIWIDRSERAGQPYVEKFKENGRPGYYKTTDQFKRGMKIHFEPNPLEEFLANGL